MRFDELLVYSGTKKALESMVTPFGFWLLVNGSLVSGKDIPFLLGERVRFKGNLEFVGRLKLDFGLRADGFLEAIILGKVHDASRSNFPLCFLFCSRGLGQSFASLLI